MDNRPKFHKGALVGALAAVAATAWATSEDLSSATYAPTQPVAMEQPYVMQQTAAMPADAIAPADSLAPSETVIEQRDVDVTPPVERSLPPITVEQKRLSEDERIQAQVMDRLANNPRLSGKIAVESHDAVVRLSGYTITPGQAWHAARDAGRVTGVRYVQNEIRPKLGGSI